MAHFGNYLGQRCRFATAQYPQREQAVSPKGNGSDLNSCSFGYIQPQAQAAEHPQIFESDAL